MGLRDEIERAVRHLEATLPDGAEVRELTVYHRGQWFDAADTLETLGLPQDDTALPPGFTIRPSVEYPALANLPVWGETVDRNDYDETARRVPA
jgi:hypothetical protein